jgi:hypothetical protein
MYVEGKCLLACSIIWCDKRCFRGMYYLHLQDRIVVSVEYRDSIYFFNVGKYLLRVCNFTSVYKHIFIFAYMLVLFSTIKKACDFGLGYDYCYG